MAAGGSKGFGAPAKTAKPGGGDAGQLDKKCPCGSGKTYGECCEKHVSGRVYPPTPEALLRSRYSAYALGKVDHLVATTHPANPEHTGNDRSYKRALQRTAQSTQFIKLTILDQSPPTQQGQQQQQGAEAGEGGQEETAELSFKVRYKARQAGTPEEETSERSLFVKTGGRWLYRDQLD